MFNKISLSTFLCMLDLRERGGGVGVGEGREGRGREVQIEHHATVIYSVHA